MNIELTTVKGNGAYCRMCYGESANPYLSHEDLMEKSSINRGEGALKITLYKGNKCISNFLCIRHAHQLKNNLNDLLG